MTAVPPTLRYAEIDLSILPNRLVDMPKSTCRFHKREKSRRNEDKSIFQTGACADVFSRLEATHRREPPDEMDRAQRTAARRPDVGALQPPRPPFHSPTGAADSRFPRFAVVSVQ